MPARWLGACLPPPLKPHPLGAQPQGGAKINLVDQPAGRPQEKSYVLVLRWRPLCPHYLGQEALNTFVH